ncbi:ANTAR domain-containing protein [Streptomyces sp. NPDC018019]|uniref:ANTAR domain-containing protein n=1 Tax=Streptomyces sp. NPDC018019 TaxID=3365030 RepID=UPI0037A3D2F4
MWDAEGEELSEMALALTDAPARGLDLPQVAKELAGHIARLPGAEAVTVLVRGPGGTLVSAAASGPHTERLEQAQAEAGQGPCRDAVSSGEALVNIDLAQLPVRARWPRIAPQALAAGLTAATAVPLRHHGGALGAVGIFHRYGALAREQVRAAEVLARAAAQGWAQVEALRAVRKHADHLNEALQSRIVIEQAKGIVSERLECQVDEAFESMRRYARSRSMKLRLLAHTIVWGPPQQGPFPRRARTSDRPRV